MKRVAVALLLLATAGCRPLQWEPYSGSDKGEFTLWYGTCGAVGQEPDGKWIMEAGWDRMGSGVYPTKIEAMHAVEAVCRERP